MRDIFRAFVKAASSGLLAAFFGILAMRVLAHEVGDKGVGLFGELREIQRIVVLIGTFGGGQAVIQGIASREPSQRTQFSAEIFKLQILIGVALSALLCLLSPFISRAVFGNTHHFALFIFMSVPVLAAIAFSFSIAMINGRILVAAFAICQGVLAFSIWLLAIPLGLVAKHGNDYAYVLLLTVPFLLAAIIGAFILYREHAFDGFWQHFKNKIQWREINLFLRIARAMFITQVLASAVILGLRTGLIHRFGLALSGKFDPAWTISMVYLTGILSAFNVYYFPKLSALEDREGRNNLTEHMLRLSSVIMGIALIFIILTRNLVIDHLYGTKFLEATQAMRWMLIGDFLRASSLFPTVLLIGRNHVKPYVVLELLMNGIFLALGVVGLFTRFPLDLLGIGYAGSYLVRLVVSIYYVRKKGEFRPSPILILGWLMIISGLIIADIASWNIDIRSLNEHYALCSLLILFTGVVVLMKRYLVDRFPLKLQR